MTDARAIVLDRLDLVARELAALRDLVAGVTATPSAPAAQPVAAANAPVDELPPEPDGELAIDPAQAATLLGIARQTIDRRLKDGRIHVPGGPVDVSQGAVRSRWRWRSEADVKRWWAAVR